ncbi:hypothetical protein [Okeania sp.]|uniref:hypothetical protein n=1 Tax=Okeania sp. TaxID=3100323 RepID=UPI002B4ADF2B|nr:hypothetical protein [Okeania sp.]MEB3339512.1 hypothetical protein [Okeania sp.]
MKLKINNSFSNNQEDLPTINIMPGEDVEKYRGQNRGQGWNYPYPRHIPRHGHPPQKTVCSMKEPLSKEGQNTLIVQAAIQQHVEAKNNTAQVDKINLCNILERQYLLAKARGDEKLLSLLKDEWQCMSCG